VDLNEQGQIISKPCEITITAYKQPPEVFFNDDYIRMLSYIKFKIMCTDKFNVLSSVIELDTRTLIEFKIIISNDLTLKIKMRRFKLTLESIPSSNLGQINSENIN
jgi:hypothetical protein